MANPVAATFDLLGDRLTLEILRHAFLHHTRRFNQWLDRTGAPPAVLTTRLTALADARVLVRVPQPGRSDRFEYRLTGLGLSIWEILVCLWAWQREWIAEGALQPELVHVVCGHRGPPALMCRGCGSTITAHDTDVEFSRDVLWNIVTNGRRRSRAALTTTGGLQYTAVMEAIGDRWSAAVTGLALAGVRRFSGFRQALLVSPTTLTERLSRLCDARILYRTDDGAGREYRLTPRGLGLFGIFAFLLAWSDRAHAGALEPGLRIRHSDCAARLVPGLACRGCQHPLERAEVRFESIFTADRPSGSLNYAAALD